MTSRFRCSGRSVVLAAVLALLLFLVPSIRLAHYIYFDRSGLPDLERFIRFEIPTIGKVYDAQGAVLVELAREYRRVISYDEVPPVLRDAILAAEDRNFFTHSGVEYRALPRVAYKTMVHSVAAWWSGAGIRLHFPHGGSTLTQQLVRGYFLRDRSSREGGAALFRENVSSRLLSAALGVPATNKLLRKLEEIRLSIWLEQEMRQRFAGSQEQAKREIFARPRARPHSDGRARRRLRPHRGLRVSRPHRHHDLDRIVRVAIFRVKNWRNQLLDMLKTGQTQTVIAFRTGAHQVVDLWPGATGLFVAKPLHSSFRDDAGLRANWNTWVPQIRLHVTPDAGVTPDIPPGPLITGRTVSLRRRRLRPFRYLRIPPQDRERVHLVRERVKCGKPSCHCARGLRHGPYTFLRYQYWDGAAGRDRYAREYMPRSELPRVRRWIRRVRAETALGWGQAGLCSNRGPILKQIFQRVLRVGVFLQWLVLLTMMSERTRPLPHARKRRTRPPVC